MPRFTIRFEMSDAMMSRAVREDCVALAREYVSVRDLLVVLASTGVFALAVLRDAHWVWWLAGLPTIMVAVLALGWLAAFLWLPRAARNKLAHLPNRNVVVDASDATLSFTTANERLEVAWTELKAVKRRPGFWLFCLRSGARIPVPVQWLSDDEVARLNVDIR
jgi:hypothetical protein